MVDSAVLREVLFKSKLNELDLEIFRRGQENNNGSYLKGKHLLIVYAASRNMRCNFFSDTAPIQQKTIMRQSFGLY